MSDIFVQTSIWRRVARARNIRAIKTRLAGSGQSVTSGGGSGVEAKIKIWSWRHVHYTLLTGRVYFKLKRQRSKQICEKSEKSFPTYLQFWG